MHGRVGVIGGCEFGGVRRDLRYVDDLERSYFQKYQGAPATHNWVHAKGLINYGHAIVELRYVFIGLYRVSTARKQILHLLEFGHQVLHP